MNTNSEALPDKANVHVSEGYISINPLLQSETEETNMQNILDESIPKNTNNTNNTPFPASGNSISDYTYPSTQALAFPTLFPCGDGDVAFRDQNYFVSIADSNRHLLKYCFYDTNKRVFLSFSYS